MYSYFSVFGLNKKTLPLSDETLCGGESGHQYEGGILWACKRKFGQYGQSENKTLSGMEHGHQCEGGIFSEGKRKFGQSEVADDKEGPSKKKRK